MKKDKLIWPTLIEDIDIENKVIEHIEIKTITECTIEDLLHEIEFEFPRISNILSLLVGHKEFEIEMNKLLIDDRGNRKGFSKHILNSLMRLSEAHLKKYGKLNISDTILYKDQFK